MSERITQADLVQAWEDGHSAARTFYAGGPKEPNPYRRRRHANPVDPADLPPDVARSRVPGGDGGA